MNLRVLILLFLFCVSARASAAATNAAPVEAKPPIVNVAAPTFPKGLSVQIERGWGDFGYDLAIALVGLVLNLGLLWFGGWWIAKRVEKYKIRETLRVEASKETAREMNRLSRLLFDLEYSIETKAEELRIFDEREREDNKEHDHFAWVKLYKELSWPLEDLKKKVSKEIEATRFWLGRNGFAKFMAHYDLLEQYDGLLETRKWTEAKELWEKIDAARPYVSDILDES